MATRSFNFSVTYCSTPQMDRVINGRFSVSLALLLTSRRVNALTARILLLRGNFRVYTVRDLQRLFDMLEHGKLSFVRRIHISLSNIDSDKDFAEDTVAAENAFERCISLINRLSSNLLILNIHPLVEFRWVTGCDARGIGNSVPHPPPTKDHLEALQKKHGHTLRWLIMQYGYWLREISEPATFVFTADDVETFLRDLDLEGVVITVPHINLCLAILMLAFERQASFS
ncbi:predicted protein [Histoplasma mississippiense (nom. inval.)]|uniref:predicted protein n=1 Tax=Ajellomyces capsulatus (strain NAm1 / WU24) TaxID=2059318 RepID=UPI000157BE2C|nr:predicted protein [Histoplasma mississippiense (nom. inval.)]EDN06690.1 predicted protein [Histoplasma mississippiense (nom. inval.)]